MSFAGFPAAGLTFLRELSAHNDREWFEKHRAPWDEQIVPAMLEWLSELQTRLRDVLPNLVLAPRQGGSLYRLARDTRFSKDKHPYHAYAAGLLWDGGERHDSPGVYLRDVGIKQLLGCGALRPVNTDCRQR